MVRFTWRCRTSCWPAVPSGSARSSPPFTAALKKSSNNTSAFLRRWRSALSSRSAIRKASLVQPRVRQRKKSFTGIVGGKRGKPHTAMTKDHLLEGSIVRDSENEFAHEFCHSVRMRIDMERHRLKITIPSLERAAFAQTVATLHTH